MNYYFFISFLFYLYYNRIDDREKMNSMKKFVFLTIVMLLISGCGKKEETIAATCSKSEIQSTYTATYSVTLKTMDGKSITNLETSSIYNATYTDTNMTNIRNTLKTEEDSFKRIFKDVVIDKDEKQDQIFFNVLIPINENNINAFQDSNSTFVTDGRLNLSIYRKFLSAQGYVCS